VLTDAQARLAHCAAFAHPNGHAACRARAQANWRAHGTWSLQFLRQSFPEDAVLCADKASSRGVEALVFARLTVALERTPCAGAVPCDRRAAGADAAREAAGAGPKCSTLQLLWILLLKQGSSLHTGPGGVLPGRGGYAHRTPRASTIRGAWRLPVSCGRVAGFRCAPCARHARRAAAALPARRHPCARRGAQARVTRAASGCCSLADAANLRKQGDGPAPAVPSGRTDASPRPGARNACMACTGAARARVLTDICLS
jgi:hypothetical protein